MVVTIARKGQYAIKRIRAKLRAVSPICHWCGCATLPAMAGPFHPDMETVDHIKPRWQCGSVEEYHAESNYVLACLECNNERDRVDVRMLAHQREELARVEKLRVPMRRMLLRTARRAS